MVDAHQVKKQLQQIGADFKFWGRPELRELPKILFENEQLFHVLNGRYEGGFAVLCATSHRVLLIDKKPFYLTLEDIRYDMISDVMFNHRLLDASVLLGTMGKTISFTGYTPSKLREMTAFIQQKVTEFRRMHDYQAAHDQVPAINPVEAMVSPQAPVNPYKLPVTIRRRASKYL